MKNIFISIALLVMSFGVSAENVTITVSKDNQVIDSLIVSINTQNDAFENMVHNQNADVSVVEFLNNADSMLKYNREMAYIESCEIDNDNHLLTPGTYNHGVGAYAYKNNEDQVMVYVKSLTSTKIETENLIGCSVQTPQSDVYSWMGQVSDEDLEFYFEQDDETYKINIALNK